ncbi:MAG: TIM barrel protein [Opitutales bacterium]|nr:TIM barrel protein [Opitutales bacterium]
MNRRTFSKNALGAIIATASLGASARAAESASQKPFNCKFAPNIYKWTNLCPNLTSGMSDADKIKWWYDQGFRAMEDNDMLKYPAEKQEICTKTREKLGMQFGVFTSSIGGKYWLTACKSGEKAAPDRKAAIERIKKEAAATVEAAKRFNATWTTVVPGYADHTLEHSFQMANVVEQLKYAAEICEKAGVVMVLEPLSFQPHPLHWLRKTSDAYMICKAVNSPSCKILFDVYHQQNTEGSLIRNIDDAFDEIAYFHLGDCPLRTEPLSGEINYKNLIAHIHGKGYRGLYGMEHRQSDKTLEGDKRLLQIYREIDVA